MKPQASGKKMKIVYITGEIYNLWVPCVWLKLIVFLFNAPFTPRSIQYNATRYCINNESAQVNWM